MSTRRKKPMKDWAKLVAEKIGRDAIACASINFVDIETWAQWIREAECADRNGSVGGVVSDLRAATPKGTKKPRARDAVRPLDEITDEDLRIVEAIAARLEREPDGGAPCCEGANVELAAIIRREWGSNT